jgi:integrase
MLTDAQCRTAKPRAKPYKLTDYKGLYLEVKPNGTKAWRYRFRLPKHGVLKENVFAIGDYENAKPAETPADAAARRAGRVFTLAEARDERSKARALVTQGINPAGQRRLEGVKRAYESAITFEPVSDEWLALRDWMEITRTRRRDMLERVVFPKLRDIPLREIAPAHILDILQCAAKNNGPTVAAEAQRTMSAIFDFAISTLRADANPVYPVRKALPPNKTQHKRALTVIEIGQLLRDFDGHGANFQTMSAFKLMWLTLCRPSEVTGARWEEFDLEEAIWILPAERMKKRKEHRVPLPNQAVVLVRALQGMAGRSEFVFPHRDDRKRPMTAATFRQALKVLGWSGKYSPHATRTTGSTHLNEMGYTSDWIERQLAHVETNAVRRTYNQADHLASRRAMMQAWADNLDQLKIGADIVMITRRAL